MNDIKIYGQCTMRSIDFDRLCVNAVCFGVRREDHKFNECK